MWSITYLWTVETFILAIIKSIVWHLLRDNEHLFTHVISDLIGTSKESAVCALIVEDWLPEAAQ